MTPLHVDNVSKTYRQGDRVVEALRGVTLDVARGQFVAIMGASGSGKSTLLHLTAGLTKAETGGVYINGQDLGKMNDAQLTRFRRDQIGLVFQSFNLIPTLSAEDNILLPVRLARKMTDADHRRVEELIDLLGIGPRRHHKPDALSGGEQQRVAIGRALINDPAVILADEPTGNLDSVNSRSVCELLRDLCRLHGKTIVMVTHEPSVAAYANDVAVIKDGKVVDSFSTESTPDQQSLAARYQSAIGPK
ncbi:MAG: ABC transporter ATP-binding protein [Burkholderiales bacterium]|nr:ABC transporter ATP-binding protein [Phycisphaerae bacterium]